MMKWLKGFLGVLFLASIMSLNIGCGDDTATQLEGSGDEPPPPAGHAAAQKEMNKKPR